MELRRDNNAHCFKDGGGARSNTRLLLCMLAYESYDNFIAFNNTIAYFNAKLYNISTKEIHLDIPVKKRVIKIQMPRKKQET